MFGLGFSEMVVVGIVLLVVVGPRELPKLLRTVGRGITKLKAMSAELRDQSGIDEIISDENLREDLNAIRSLSRGNVVNTLMKDNRPRPRPAPRPAPLPSVDLKAPEGEAPDPEQEYPALGCDDYGVLADDAIAPTMHLHHEADVGGDAGSGEDDEISGDGDGSGNDDEADDDEDADGDGDADGDEDEDEMADSGPRDRAEAS